MTKYYAFYCSNGFCGCDEVFYKEVDEKKNLDNLAEDILFNEYGFAEPDGRFIDGKSFEDEITEEEEEEYQNDLSVYYEEISKEEYKENK